LRADDHAAPEPKEERKEEMNDKEEKKEAEGSCTIAQLRAAAANLAQKNGLEE